MKVLSQQLSLFFKYSIIAIGNGCFFFSAMHILGNQVYKSYPENARNISAPTWLWLEKLNLYVYSDSTNNTHLFYASDDKSTKELLKVGDDLKISNVGFWHLASINNQTWQVLKHWIIKANNK